MSFVLAPFRAVRDLAGRHPYVSATAGIVAAVSAGYWTYQKLAPIVYDIQDMMRMLDEQQKAEAAKARELDPYVEQRTHLPISNILSRLRTYFPYFLQIQCEFSQKP